MTPVLEIKNVSKLFQIDYLGYRPDFREMVSGIFTSRRIKKENFWALRDLSFDIYPGDSVAIIGKNGSGKSTLLKILARITPPTKGKIIIRSKLGCLLEVGTGFHPELTGRENVYLNGAILGMKRLEIYAKFDEIVDFAEIDKFLDTPLKRYSSGMQLRLAFAVAAFLDLDTVVVDEVLAVGDAEFQQKCLHKMKSINDEGKTLLFVSHNMSAIQQICKKAILLEKGQIKKQGLLHESMNNYAPVDGLSQHQNKIGEYISDASDSITCITKIYFLAEGKLSDTFYMGGDMEINVHFKSDVPIQSLVAGVVFYDNQNAPILSFNNRNYAHPLVAGAVKEGMVSIRLPVLPFVPNTYYVDIYLNDASLMLDMKKNVIQLTVKNNEMLESTEKIDTKFNKFFVNNVLWKAEIEE